MSHFAADTTCTIPAPNSSVTQPTVAAPTGAATATVASATSTLSHYRGPSTTRIAPLMVSQSSPSADGQSGGSRRPNADSAAGHDALAGARFGWIVSPLAGACAGALAKTTIAPLDRTKINFQINKDIPYSFRAATNYLADIYRTEGFAALYRGNSATMVRIVPYAAIQFTAHERWRRVLGVDADGQNTSARRFVAGSLAGVTSQSLTYPLDLARARMAVSPEPTTLRRVFTHIWCVEGPRTLLRGYVATVLGIIPYAGTSFYTYETLKRQFNEWPGERRHASLYMLAFGAVAGAIGQSTSYPLDIVRRRMQTEGVIVGAEDQYKTILSSLRNIYRHEGVRGGFFKGLSMNWIKGPIAVGVSFSTYDLIKNALQKQIVVND